MEGIFRCVERGKELKDSLFHNAVYIDSIVFTYSIYFAMIKCIQYFIFIGAFMSRKRVKVIQESGTGRNEKFHDNYSHSDMSRAQFVEKIEQGDYPKYHVRGIGGVKTPASNPDGKVNNNLD